MKNKTKNDEIVTRAILDEALEEKLNKKLSNYPTKIQVEIMMDKLKTEISDSFRKYRDEVLTRMDQIVGVLAQMREDREFDQYDKRKSQEQLDNHEKRISKLER